MSKQDYKVVILGASGVGKTCLGLRFVKDQFVNYTASTIGASFLVKELVFNNTKMTMQIWDTAGQERFKTITTAYYRGAMGILLVYDVTSESSFANVNQWMGAIRQHASDSVNKVLLGNKADTSGPLVSKRTVATARGQALAEQHGIPFFETSAKNGINIEEAFSAITRDIKQRLLDGGRAGPGTSGPGGTIRLSSAGGANAASGKKGCC